MRFDYAITVDDLREAARPVRPDGRPRRSSVARGLIGWGVFMLLATVLVWLVTASSAPPRPPFTLVPPPVPPSAAVPTQNLWVTLVPPLVATGMLMMAAVIEAVRRGAQARRAVAAIAAGRPVPPPPAKAPRWVAWVFVSPCLLLLVWNVPALAVPWTPTPGAP